MKPGVTRHHVEWPRRPCPLGAPVEPVRVQDEAAQGRSAVASGGSAALRYRSVRRGGLVHHGERELHLMARDLDAHADELAEDAGGMLLGKPRVAACGPEPRA